MNKLRTIRRFYKENKVLLLLSIVAILYVVFYCIFTSDEKEKSNEVILDTIFQLSLALIANFIFFIFQVYIPKYRRSTKIQTIIRRKLEEVCRNINAPFVYITKKYLGKTKRLSELSSRDKNIIAEKYCPEDKIKIVVEQEVHELTFRQYFQICSEKNRENIQELLTYETYLTDYQKDLLICINEAPFCQRENFKISLESTRNGKTRKYLSLAFGKYCDLYCELEKLISDISVNIKDIGLYR